MQHEESEDAHQQKIHEQGGIMQPGVMRPVVWIGVRIILHETGVGARMALSASRDQLSGRDRRLRIRGGKYGMVAMTILAARRLLVTQSRHLGMEGIAPGGEFIFMATSACRGGLHLKLRRAHPGDLVCGMAIGAYGRLRDASLQHLTVNAGGKSLQWPGVASPAGLRDVRVTGLAFGVLAAQDAVRSVATGAIGGHQQPVLSKRETVNRIDVERVHLWQLRLACKLSIPMTGAARPGQVRRVSRSLRIAGFENGVRTAVATQTGRSARSCMHALSERSGGFGMARGAIHRCLLRGVWVGLNGGVASRAGHTSVNTILNLCLFGVAREAIRCSPGCGGGAERQKDYGPHSHLVPGATPAV